MTLKSASKVKVKTEAIITLKHLDIYQTFKGDGDMLIRLGSEPEKQLLKYDIWKLIEGFIQDINLISDNLVSQDYRDTVNERLKMNCDNQETIDRLKTLAKSNDV